MSEATDTPPTWAIVELMGHVTIAGRLTEEEKFGSKLGRLDIPDGQGCSGISAGWCPVCGDCTCKDPTDMNDDACPLHSHTSEHGEVQGERWRTTYFNGGSVYRIQVVSEAVARHVARSVGHLPVSPWDFPKQLPAAEPAEAHVPSHYERDEDDEDNPDDDDDLF
jgi:hypothetical protein